jgi:hypothetical protein
MLLFYAFSLAHPSNDISVPSFASLRLRRAQPEFYVQFPTPPKRVIQANPQNASAPIFFLVCRKRTNGASVNDISLKRTVKIDIAQIVKWQFGKVVEIVALNSFR